MRKSKTFELIIYDVDRKKYATTGKITNDDPWNKRVCEEQEKGREIRCTSIIPSNIKRSEESMIKEGYSKTTIENILSPPEDTSSVYNGHIPNYAKKANKRRIIKIQCRERCNQTRWAEMNCDYPGKESLKNATMGDIHAICLKCGYKAIDSYNWMR